VLTNGLRNRREGESLSKHKRARSCMRRYAYGVLAQSMPAVLPICAERICTWMSSLARASSKRQSLSSVRVLYFLDPRCRGNVRVQSRWYAIRAPAVLYMLRAFLDDRFCVQCPCSLHDGKQETSFWHSVQSHALLPCEH